jgi:hypothetical protein
LKQRIISLLCIVAVHILLLQFIPSSRPALPAREIITSVKIYPAATITKFSAPAPRKIPSEAKRPVRKPRLSQPKIIVEPTPLSAEPESSALAVAEPSAATVDASASSAAEKAAAESVLLTMPPPSCNYQLQVVRTEPDLANPYYGAGEIRWRRDEHSYHMDLEVWVDLLFTKVHLYSVSSLGTLSETGIKPTKMTESRRGRPTTTTSFNYDDQTISFSADAKTIPLSSGAQDRATILMQLASIGYADPGQFQPDKVISIQVAEDTEANLFQFVLVGQETIETKLGQLATWHIVRPPQPGLYSSQLDIWLAPKLNWLPVKMRNTESNGAMTIQTITRGC